MCPVCEDLGGWTTYSWDDDLECKTHIWSPCPLGCSVKPD